MSLAAVSATAQESPPRVADLVARNSYTFEFSATTLRGAGADFLRGQTAGTQFVLLGEDHMDHATPLFAGALFRMLHDAHGYRHLVVEQDPVAIEDALQPDVRGHAERIAAHARRYPTLYEFDTDEDLDVSRPGGRPRTRQRRHLGRGAGDRRHPIPRGTGCTGAERGCSRPGRGTAGRCNGCGSRPALLGQLARRGDHA